MDHDPLPHPRIAAMLKGLDISWHQGRVDFAQVARGGADFVVCKATDGTSYSHVDYYLEAIPRMRAAVESPGAYHWLRAGPSGELRDPVGQARYFVSVIGDPTGLICALDVEWVKNSAGVVISKPRIDSVRAFYAEWNRLTGGHPLPLYTGSWYWRDQIGNPHGADLAPLWHSEYETTQAEVDDGPEGDRYGGWPGATFWQFTSDGRWPGVAGRVDVNVFYGDRAALRALTGQSAPPPPTPIVQEDDMFVMYAPNFTHWLVIGIGRIQIDEATYKQFEARGVTPLTPTAEAAGAIYAGTISAPELLAAVREGSTAALVALTASGNDQRARIAAAFPPVDTPPVPAPTPAPDL